MSEHDTIAHLLPWYANGTLDPAQRVRVERHLTGCTRCAEQLERDRALVGLAAVAPTEALLEHVAPDLAVRYAEDPAALEPETVAWIESKLRDCAACREAVGLARQVTTRLPAGAEPETASPPPVAAPGRLVGAVRAAWDGLSSTILRPLPALAYLLLLLVLPALWFSRAPGPGPASAPLVLDVSGERATRGEDPRAEPAPVFEIPRTDDPTAPVLLRLVTELSPAELAGASFVVELQREGRPIWTQVRRGEDFAIEQGRAVLPLVIYPARLVAGREHRVRILARRPGDPLDGQALFRRAIRVGAD